MTACLGTKGPHVLPAPPALLPSLWAVSGHLPPLKLGVPHPSLVPPDMFTDIPFPCAAPLALPFTE